MLLNQDQIALRDMVNEFVRKEIVPVANALEKEGHTPHEILDKAIDMGLGCLYMPEEYGGPGLDKVSFCLLCEALSYGDLGIATTLTATCLATLPVLIAGTDAQKKHWFETVQQKKYAAFCLTEPGAGSDAAAQKTTAVRDGGDYILNGTKCFISNGGLAGIYSVLAVTDKTAGIKGLTCFMVDRDTPGISIGKEEDKMGMRLSNTTEVVFENVRVPAAHMLGKPGGGFQIMMKTLDASRPAVGAQGVGIAQRALDEAVQYAKERVQFGRPIAKLQAIQFILADMEIEIQSAREMYLHAAELADAGLPFTKEACAAKCKGGDVAVKCALDGLQVLGGYGYMRDYPMEKLVRDAKIIQIYEGTNQIQRSVIARELLK